MQTDGEESWLTGDASVSVPFGILAEFESVEELFRAVRTVRENGFKEIDAYSPFPIHELDDVLGIKKTILPKLVFLGGLAGALSGFIFQVFVSKISYPLNVGGRPLISWPSFIPVTFEFTVLFAGVTAVVGMFALNRLPEPYHPVFDAPNFSDASKDKFFLLLEATDPLYEEIKIRKLLKDLKSVEVTLLEKN